jgi:chitin-binding protein
MPAARTIAAAVAGVAPLLLTAVAAGPAQAHGAPTSPVSRAAACGPEGGQKAQSVACLAAKALSGVQVAQEWDNIRVPDVGGRDREVIPDGRLCSGGIARFRGLDLPRSDWPTTRLTAGARFTFKYRGTIPHRGSFRLYVTKNGYDPSRRLRWSDLQSRPFLTAKDPDFRNGSYVFAGKLPTGKTGRHLIYTVWENTSTPDTYYSCSDVTFTGAGGGAGSGGEAKDGASGDQAGGSGNAGAAAPSGQPGAGAGQSSAEDSSAGAGQSAAGTADSSAEAAESSAEDSAGPSAEGDPARSVSSQRGLGGALPLAAAGAAALLTAGAGAFALRRRRPSPGAGSPDRGSADQGSPDW